MTARLLARHLHALPALTSMRRCAPGRVHGAVRVVATGDLAWMATWRRCRSCSRSERHDAWLVSTTGGIGVLGRGAARSTFGVRSPRVV
jgi:hypothetical protein